MEEGDTILLMHLPQEDLNEPTLQTSPLPDLENVQTHLTNHLQGQIEGKGQILVTNLQLERDEIVQIQVINHHKELDEQIQTLME